MWANPSDPAEGRTAKFTPSHESIRRSPEGFLEPAVALADWANPSSLGAPTLNGEGTPLGFKVSPGVAAWDPMVSYLPSPVCGWTWVMAKTILSGNRLIARPFTAKEKGQILDLREDWQDAAAHAWTALKGTGIDPFPARVGTEFGIIALNWWAPHFARGEGKVARPVGWDRPRVVPGARPSESQASALIQGVFGSLVEPTDALTISVAVKSDKASVDTSMWNVGGSSRAAVRAREVLQRCLHRRWYCRLEREALAWLNQEAQQLATSEEQRANGEAIRDCLRRARNSTWFEWNDGSRLFFWRWPPDLQREARDGSPVCHHYIPPRRCDARVPSDVEPWMAAMVNDKLRKFFRRRHIIPFPRRLTRVPIVYFPVKKGEEDIRMVWSETEQGITDSVFAPRIFYPNPGTLLRRLPNNAFIGDFDIGEQFHDFCLIGPERPNHGVLLPEELWEELGCDAGVWARLPMGFRPSPYMAAKMTLRAIEFAKADPNDPTNPFAFATVTLNLPGSPNCDPSLGIRVIKLDADGKPAGDVVICADDGRTFGHDFEHAMRCLRACCTRLEFLGMQDAKRKRRPGSQRPGAWAGAAVFTDQGATRSFLQQDRWDKAKRLVAELSAELAEFGAFETKHFLSARGFLVHASMTCEFIVPFMKGLHLTADAWRPLRDSQGWKYTTRKMSDAQQDERSALATEDFEVLMDCLADDDELSPAVELDLTCATQEEESDPNIERDPETGDVKRAPPRLEPVPGVKSDLMALRKTFDSEAPLMVPRSAGQTVCLTCGFGDASGEGFGSRMHSPELEERVRLRRGFWCSEVSERSSNYREFRNILETVRDYHQERDLTGSEVWLFTDNLVTESVGTISRSSNFVSWGGAIIVSPVTESPF